jgi:hypothetical protein
MMAMKAPKAVKAVKAVGAQRAGASCLNQNPVEERKLRKPAVALET